MILYGLTVCTIFSVVALAHAGPPGWSQVNEDGFVSGLGPTTGTDLLVFDGKLYARNNNGFFRMEDPLKKEWTKLAPPAPPAGPGASPDGLRALGSYLYAWVGTDLWWVVTGNDPNGNHWQKVTSTPVSPIPMAVFGGRLYGVRYTSWDTFQIWRSPHIGSALFFWEMVVNDSFGDPANNWTVDLMIVFNGRIIVGVGTLNLITGMFGWPNTYGSGVEMWESATGSAGTWAQVNLDGFGTLFQGCWNPDTVFERCLFPIHQVLGSAVSYQAPDAHEASLYVGTKSHFGSQIWQYEGSGVYSWTNVTPPWAGPGPVSNPGRNAAMAVFNGELYLAEGFPGARLAKYDGEDWTIVVMGPPFPNGPHPFDPDIRQLLSLAVYQDRLYVSAAGEQTGTQADQVWGYPFPWPGIVPPLSTLLLTSP